MTVHWYGDMVASAIEKAAMDGAEAWARVDVETDAKEHCPVDRGTLRGTHTTEREGNEVIVGVGGPSAPYATIQHEDASFNHTVGEDHWLENAFMRNLPELPVKIAGKVKGIL